MITVGALAEKLSIPVSRLITELMKNGVMATVNERIDFDTAQIIVDELGLEVALERGNEAEPVMPRPKKTAIDNEHAVPRPPVVAFMGHVDHGKTSLLDAIRGAETAKHEAGGITQHISAYQISHNGRPITLLDTPGHEAFAAIREHGAHLTDLAVIVVAADDGVKPQTIEAIRFARKAGVRIIVAINKIDKEGADVNRVKQELAEQNLLIEEWSGDIVAAEVSAKTKQGLENLLEMILLVSDVEELKSEADGPASGLIIEAHTEQGRGPVAHALIESGLLKRGDFIVAGGSYAKVRNLEDSGGSAILGATPAMPVTITGFKTLPEFGDEFRVVASERIAKEEAERIASGKKSASGRLDLGGNDLIHIINRTNTLQNFNVIIKADVQGSLASAINSIKVLDTEEVAVRVVGSGVGAISENDIHLADTSGAVVYGFNVTTATNIRRLANRDKVNIREYQVIYELIDDVRQELSNLLAPEVVETELGSLKTKAVFKTTKTEVICGGEVTKGNLSLPARARVLRGKEQIAEAEITNLKRGPQDVKEVLEGELCGISLKTENRLLLEEGDVINAFRREVVERKL